jgi:hypothetical protein
MRMRSEFLGAASAGLCALAACHGSGTSAAVDGAVERTADAAADSPTAGICSAHVPPGQVCNALVLTGAAVTPTCTTGTMPTGQGGTIVDGTYVLTAATYYTASDCPTDPMMETIELAEGCFQASTGPPPLTTTGSETFTIAGSNITFTRTCFQVDAGHGATVVDNGPATPATFTATDTTFSLFVQRATQPSSDLVFTKQ